MIIFFYFFVILEIVRRKRSSVRSTYENVSPRIRGDVESTSILSSDIVTAQDLHLKNEKPETTKQKQKRQNKTKTKKQQKVKNILKIL